MPGSKLQANNATAFTTMLYIYTVNPDFQSDTYIDFLT